MSLAGVLYTIYVAIAAFAVIYLSYANYRDRR